MINGESIEGEKSREETFCGRREWLISDWNFYIRP